MDEYNRYLLTYPHTGDKIYRSKSLKKVIRRCYDDFKQLNDIDEGMFAVTNIDKNEEYTFRIQNRQIIKMAGGNPNKESNEKQTEALMRIQTSLNDHSKTGMDVKDYMRGRFDSIAATIQQNNRILKGLDIKLNDLLNKGNRVEIQQVKQKECDKECDGCVIS